MKKVLVIAAREFISVVLSKAFIIGLLVLPTIISIGVLVGPRIFGTEGSAIDGKVAVIDMSGSVVPELRSRLLEQPRRAAPDRPGESLHFGNSMAPAGSAGKLELVERPASSDVQSEKEWLLTGTANERHLALAVIHKNAVEPSPGERSLGAFDLFLATDGVGGVENDVQAMVREAIVDARMKARGLDRAAITRVEAVPRARSVVVAPDGERDGVGAFNVLLPLAFMMLLFVGVIGSGQSLLTSTIEEKSSRVIEVMLSAVSPMQLMAGKLLGHMGVSLLALCVYTGLGLLTLASFSLLGLFDLPLLGYLLPFFLIAFLTMASLMMAAGAAVNDIREAQSLIMPIMIVFLSPLALWEPIWRNPDSGLATVASFLPPVNAFGMLLRIASSSPPPIWQVVLSIGIGAAGVIVTVWFAAKVFRIGLLMFGKPPDLRTLARWARAG